MSRRLRALGYALGRSLDGIRRAPRASSWAVGAVAVAFLLVGVVQLARANVQTMTSAWGKASMVVYLEDGVVPARAEEIRTTLAELPAVETAAYVPEDQALARLRAALGDHGELIDGIAPAMLPASIEVSLRAGVKDVAQARPVAQRLQSMAGVEEVEFTGEWVERQAALVSGLRRASMFLLVLVAGACLYIVTVAMRGRAQGRRREAEVMALLGASDGFVRIPPAIEGALHGGLGASLAVLLLWALYALTRDTVGMVLGTVFGGVHVAFLPPAEIALLIAAGAALGLLGSVLATRQHAFA